MQPQVKPQFLICATVPALAMAAAHYFPWRASFGRELPRLAAYAIGTTGIVAAAAGAIASDDGGTAQDHAALLLTAAASAGAATCAAWLWDHVLDLRNQITEFTAYGDALGYIHRSQPDG